MNQRGLKDKNMDNLQKINHIVNLLDKTLPSFFLKVNEYKGAFGDTGIKIVIATSDYQISNVSGQYTDCVSLYLDNNEIYPQIFGGMGGQNVYVKPDLENPSEKYLAMKGMKVPFRKTKHQGTEEEVFSKNMKMLEKFAQNYKATLIEYRGRLRHESIVDYNKLLGV